jgi:hypothetical protein
VLTAVVLVFIAGCGKIPGLGGDVALVKNGYLGNEKSMTVGKIFDNYKYFKSTTWKSFKSERGQRVVEFNGVIDSNKMDEFYKPANYEANNLIYGYRKFNQLVVSIQFIINDDNSFKIQGGKKTGKLADGSENSSAVSESNIQAILDNNPIIFLL